MTISGHALPAHPLFPSFATARSSSRNPAHPSGDDHVGGPATTIDGNLTGMVGRISIPLIRFRRPRAGNSTTSPSSGFFQRWRRHRRRLRLRRRRWALEPGLGNLGTFGLPGTSARWDQV